MITPRYSDERGHFNHGWRDTYHTFSFADYMDTRFMGFRSLRVINEDVVKPGEGFPTHSHRDMEIITYILDGELEHKDSMGNGSVIRPGEVQKMSAGAGITHSEYNHSKKSRVHLLQIWILPNQKGIKPNYDQRAFKKEDAKNRLYKVASGTEAGAIKIYQDAEIFTSLLDEGRELRHALGKGRGAWIQVAKGVVEMKSGVKLRAGDGAAVENESEVSLAARENSEFLLFDLG